MLSLLFTFTTWLKSRTGKNDQGEVSLEYVLVGGLAAAAIVVAMATFDTAVTGWFESIANTIGGALPVVGS